MEHPVVKHIGAYRLKKHLAASGTVQVYLAQEEGPVRLSNDVVLKIVHPLSPEDAGFDELRAQGPLLCQLNHSSIVRTHRFFEHESALVFVLEYVKGVTVAELLADPHEGRRLSDAAVFHIASSVLDALAHAHRLSEHARSGTPSVHKAVSPSNIHITREGTVKLGGFGFVKPFGIIKDATGKLQWESAYMAPEQIGGQVPSQKVDVYAAGLVLWELLAGRAARKAPESPNAIEAALLDASARGPESIGSLRPDLPADVLALIDAALLPNPEMRVIKCADMAQRIRRAAAGGRGKEELKALVTAALPAEVTAPLKQASSIARTLPGIPPPAVLPNGAQQQRAAVPPPPRVARPSPTNVQGPSAVIPMPIVEVSGSFEPMPAPLAMPEPLVMLSSTGAVVTTLPPVVETAASIPALETGVGDRPSLVDQLQKPTRWRRKPLLGVWGGLTVALVATVVATQTNRRPSASPSIVISGAELAPLPSATAPTAEPSEEPTAGEPTAGPSETTAPAEDTAEPPLAPGLGYLTVHSMSSTASVYVMLKKKGGVEEKLAVPCGKQFISIGVMLHKKETMWLAPGKNVEIPCGGSIDMTMEARVVK